MKYRVIWNTLLKKVTSVIMDQNGIITNYPSEEIGHEEFEHAVITDLQKIKVILQSENYDVSEIDSYINNLE